VSGRGLLRGDSESGGTRRGDRSAAIAETIFMQGELYVNP
jgi:hypothetical protein